MRVDLSGAFKVSLDKAVAEALELEQQGRGSEAAAAFRKAARQMEGYAEYALTRADQIRRREKAAAFLERAEALERDGARVPPAKGQRPGPPSRVVEGGRPSDASFGKEIAALIHNSGITWSQIAGLEETKREIKFTYGLALADKPEGVKLEGWRRMLFYGPPGTGKTLLAAATSNGLKATFFNVKVSALLSKWFGESSRLVTALFDAARSEADAGFAVVFIDEIESLCMQRGEGSTHGAERQILSTLLTELDGLAEKGEDRFVLTIAATNAPWDLDDAILSRFQKRIFIPLPDDPARAAILELLLLRNGHHLEFPLAEIVERTAWFSGRDLERLAGQAINIMVEEANGEVPRLVDQGRKAIEDYRLKVRPLRRKDFDVAFGRIRVDAARQKALTERFKKFAENN